MKVVVLHVNIFILGFMSVSQASVRASQLSSNSLHRTVGEAVTTSYTRTFIYLRISTIGMVLFGALLISLY